MKDKFRPPYKTDYVDGGQNDFGYWVLRDATDRLMGKFSSPEIADFVANLMNWGALNPKSHLKLMSQREWEEASRRFNEFCDKFST